MSIEFNPVPEKSAGDRKARADERLPERKPPHKEGEKKPAGFATEIHDVVEISDRAKQALKDPEEGE